MPISFKNTKMRRLNFRALLTEEAPEVEVGLM
jgi:hypothetical protein